MATVRAFEFQRLFDPLTGDKGLATDFALKLTIAAIIIVKIVMRSATNRTDRIFRDGFTISSLNRFDFFLVLPFVVS